MLPTRQGSFKLFRLWGIDVHMHWSWFLLAFYSMSSRMQEYQSSIWGVLEYLSLFAIVLTHEFGHALACRQVGGQSDQIVLWPLGGVAYVNPPSRPGAMLWSIAAGPLVNVVLCPLMFGALVLAARAGWPDQSPDVYQFIRAVTWMNLSLLIFNMLPVYPLDGGQILRSLLWFPLGKARSLMAATVIGLTGGLGLLGVAVWSRQIWFGVIAVFILFQCWRSFRHARALRTVEQLPRRTGHACPVCRSAPPIGAYWRCRQCGQPFDTFATGGICPHCQAVHDVTACPDCGESRSFISWDSSIREV
ncbi:MAG: M50 family metallopeptidase [Opitutaceae bacterium]|jgi:Zn-dependent protease